MLKKLRRSTKEASEDALMRLRSREDSAAAATAIPSAEAISEETITTATRLSFFDLPAEIRNAIYDFVISDTTLSLPTSSKKPKLGPLKRRNNTNKFLIHSTSPAGILLASRQCRHEYLSLLLSTAPIEVEIKDFDFENLIRVSSHLGSFELKALQLNQHLLILLNTRNCTSRDLACLRRWLEFRQKENEEEEEKRLPWKYSFPLEKMLPSTKMGKVRLLREVEYYADTIQTMELGGAEGELGRIVEAFERMVGWLDEELGWVGQRSKTFSVRQVRGLAGGGVY